MKQSALSDTLRRTFQSPAPPDRSAFPRVTEEGFTLVELLIVITIIGVLASLSLYSVSAIRVKSRIATASTELSTLRGAIEQYKTDESVLPGMEADRITEETNQFPILFNCLYGEPTPSGPGGRSAPYMKFDEDRVVVRNEDYEEDEDDPSDEWVRAKKSEIYEEKIDKYYLDPFRRPYIFRCNRGHKKKRFMVDPRGYDLYSVGPDGEDHTILGDDVDDDEKDDISS